MKVLTPIKLPDLVLERSLREHSMADFLLLYNQSVPETFPQATEPALLEFKKDNASLFKGSNSWSPDKHRKKCMDWLPQYYRSLTLQQEK
jgi:hypothetical protein